MEQKESIKSDLNQLLKEELGDMAASPIKINESKRQEDGAEEDSKDAPHLSNSGQLQGLQNKSAAAEDANENNDESCQPHMQSQQAWTPVEDMALV